MSVRRKTGIVLSALCIPALLCRAVPRAVDLYRKSLFLPMSEFLRTLYGFPAALAVLAAVLPIKRGEAVNGALRAACAMMALYLFLWAPLYMTPMPDTELFRDAERLEAFCRTLIDEANSLLPLYAAESNEALAEEACRLMTEETGCASLKAAFLPSPRLFSRIGLAGIYCPFTGRAMVNGDQPAAALPFSLCHELAHQAGLAREEEANAAAFSACRRDQGLFRLSADYNMLLYAMNGLYEADEGRWRQCVAEMNDAFYRLFASANGMRTVQPDGVRYVQQILSDIFLKMNGETAGIKAYDLAVGLVDLTA